MLTGALCDSSLATPNSGLLGFCPSDAALPPADGWHLLPQQGRRRVRLASAGFVTPITPDDEIGGGDGMARGVQVPAMYQPWAPLPPTKPAARLQTLPVQPLPLEARQRQRRQCSSSTWVASQAVCSRAAPPPPTTLATSARSSISSFSRRSWRCGGGSTRAHMRACVHPHTCSTTACCTACACAWTWAYTHVP